MNPKTRSMNLCGPVWYCSSFFTTGEKGNQCIQWVDLCMALRPMDRISSPHDPILELWMRGLFISGRMYRAFTKNVRSLISNDHSGFHQKGWHLPQRHIHHYNHISWRLLAVGTRSPSLLWNHSVRKDMHGNCPYLKLIISAAENPAKLQHLLNTVFNVTLLRIITSDAYFGH